jgi:hypothetical protein
LKIDWKPLPQSLTSRTNISPAHCCKPSIPSRKPGSRSRDEPVDRQRRDVDRQTRQVPDMPRQVRRRRVRVQDLAAITVNAVVNSCSSGIRTTRTHPKMTESTLVPWGSSASAAFAAKPPSCTRSGGSCQHAVATPRALWRVHARTWEAV